MILAVAIQSIESLQALFFFLLNFATVNLGFFLLASYLKNNLNILSIKQLDKIPNFDSKILIPLKFIIAFIIVVFGTFGDLFESLLKRNLHIKDSGNMLPGHGGVLDRFDALFISIPTVFFYLQLTN